MKLSDQKIRIYAEIEGITMDQAYQRIADRYNFLLQFLHRDAKAAQITITLD